MNLEEKIETNKIDYSAIANDSIIIINDSFEIWDINFIVTVRGRLEFAEPMLRSFLEATNKSNLKIAYTVVEHSELAQHSSFCKKNKLNYIWIKSNSGELFNKCLAYNFGAFFSVKSKYILFHDIDCVIQSDFFKKIVENISKKKCRAIQCFNERRVLYLNGELTKKVIDKKIDFDSLDINTNGVSLPQFIGAPGGSILVDRELFFKVGGYDPELFQANSPEDIFFWDKIETIDKMYISDDPAIEVFHLNHPPTYYSNPHISEMKGYYEEFKNMSIDKKKEFIDHKSKIISAFK